MTTEQAPGYRWIEGHGDAFGAPGAEPRWTSSRKDAVGMAYSAASRIWYTISHGILNEIYFPTIDRPQVRDMEFLLTDGHSFAHEEKRDMVRAFEYIDPDSSAVRLTNSDHDGRYKIIKDVIADPHHPVVLMRVRVEGDEQLLSRMKAYALLAPHLDVGGADNSASVLDLAGKQVLLAWKNNVSLVMAASCGFSRASCGFVGASDGWQGPDGQLPDGLAVWPRAGGQYFADRRDRSLSAPRICDCHRAGREPPLGADHRPWRGDHAFRVESAALHPAVETRRQAGQSGGRFPRWRPSAAGESDRHPVARG